MTTPKPLNRFESELLGELRRQVAARAARRHRMSRKARRRLAAAGAAAGVALGIGGLALQPGSAAAFSVERESDGDVVVTINEMSDADGLERALADHGVSAEVSYDPELIGFEQENPGEEYPVWTFVAPVLEDPPAGCRPIGVDVEPADDGGVTFTLAAEYIGPQTMLHLVTTGSADELLGVMARWENSAC